MNKQDMKTLAIRRIAVWKMQVSKSKMTEFTTVDLLEMLEDWKQDMLNAVDYW